MFHLRRFHWKRRRAALALLPAAAMMITTGFTAAATGTVPGSDGTAAGATDSDVKIDVRRHARAGNTIEIRGDVIPAQSREVTVAVNGKVVGTTKSDEDGDFQLSWNAGSSGIYRVKAVVQDTTRAAGARSDAEMVNVYRPAEASYYGPGLYGNGTACGQTLTPSTVGVAHKTLPCGTKLTLRHGGRSVKVRVIDRGPYAGNREYDLTAATKAKLGFGSTGTVLTTR